MILLSVLLQACAPKVVNVQISPVNLVVTVDRPSRRELALVSTDAKVTVPLKRLQVRGREFLAVLPSGGADGFDQPFHVVRVGAPRGYLRAAEAAGSAEQRAVFTPVLWKQAAACRTTAAAFSAEIPRVDSARIGDLEPRVSTCLAQFPDTQAPAALAEATLRNREWGAAVAARVKADAELAKARDALAKAGQTATAEGARVERLTAAIPRDPNYVGGRCNRPSWTRTPHPVGACWPRETSVYKQLCLIRNFSDHGCAKQAEHILGDTYEGRPSVFLSCGDLIEIVDGGTGEFSPYLDSRLQEIADDAGDSLWDALLGAGSVALREYACEQAMLRACTRRHDRWMSGEDAKERRADQAYEQCASNVSGLADAKQKLQAANATQADLRARIPKLEADLRARQQAEAGAAGRAKASVARWSEASGRWVGALADVTAYRREAVVFSAEPAYFLSRRGSRRRW